MDVLRDNMEFVLLNIPVGFFAILFNVTTIYPSHRYNENNYVSFNGIFLLTVLPIGGAMLAGIFLTTTNPVTVTVASISKNVSGYTKKKFYIGTFFVAYCHGNLLGHF
ncbi:hypothetical protein BDA99DRAFT_531953 [Phascolomyces articulosus]|uniref:Uncharacterized protein n=1 Tax=Phascolomyces articulosus TaxID=60185 RepID=A0AAD5PIJ9_9FUNG|nr:hypothetical protein BDA99DRAFT_531953 [Phascolomyces articulosus]